MLNQLRCPRYGSAGTEECGWIGALVINARKGACLWALFPESGGDGTVVSVVEAGASASDYGPSWRGIRRSSVRLT